MNLKNNSNYIYKNKEELILEWKQMRFNFFNLYKEDIPKFDKNYSNHHLYSSVHKHFDTSFRDINQIVELEIDIFINEYKLKD